MFCFMGSLKKAFFFHFVYGNEQFFLYQNKNKLNNFIQEFSAMHYTVKIQHSSEAGIVYILQ